MNFRPLDPEDARTCNFCRHIYLDVMAGYRCRKRNICIGNIDVHRPNDCEYWLSVWQNSQKAHKDDKASANWDDILHSQITEQSQLTLF